VGRKNLNSINQFSCIAADKISRYSISRSLCNSWASCSYYRQDFWQGKLLLLHLLKGQFLVFLLTGATCCTGDTLHQSRWDARFHWW